VACFFPLKNNVLRKVLCVVIKTKLAEMLSF